MFLLSHLHFFNVHLLQTQRWCLLPLLLPTRELVDRPASMQRQRMLSSKLNCKFPKSVPLSVQQRTASSTSQTALRIGCTPSGFQQHAYLLTLLCPLSTTSCMGFILPRHRFLSTMPPPQVLSPFQFALHTLMKLTGKDGNVAEFNHRNLMTW